MTNHIVFPSFLRSDLLGHKDYSKDCAAAILYSAESGTQVALDAIQLLGES